MKIDQDKLRKMKQNMVELMCQTTTNYQSDIVIDFEWLDEMNRDGSLPSQMYFVCRPSGTQLFDAADIDTYEYYAKNQDYKIYLLYFAKVEDLESIGNYTELRDQSNDFGTECIFEVKGAWIDPYNKK